MSSGYLYGQRLAPPHKRSFGTPGGSLNSAGFGENETSAGIVGEQRVAKVLDKIAEEFLGVYVFHSFKLPGHYGDFDHVMLLKDTVVIIDTKNWRADADYEIGRDGETVYRNGETFLGGKVSLDRYVDELREYTGMAYAHGFLAIANTKSRTSHPDAEVAEWDFGNLTDLNVFLRSLVRSRGVESRTPTQLLPFTSRVVNPSFDGEWDKIVEAERAERRGERRQGQDNFQTAQNSPRPAPQAAPQASSGIPSFAWWAHFIAFPLYVFNWLPIIFAEAVTGTGDPWKFWLFSFTGIFYGSWTFRQTSKRAHPYRKGRIIRALGWVTLAVTVVTALMTGRWWSM